MDLAPFRLKPWFSERVWGRLNLKPWYEETGTTERVGEAWLTGPECVVETGELEGRSFKAVAAEFPAELGGGEFPLLVKLLFPNEKLSVQVHPDDAHAQTIGAAARQDGVLVCAGGGAGGGGGAGVEGWCDGGAGEGWGCGWQHGVAAGVGAGG